MSQLTTVVKLLMVDSVFSWNVVDLVFIFDQIQLEFSLEDD